MHLFAFSRCRCRLHYELLCNRRRCRSFDGAGPAAMRFSSLRGAGGGGPRRSPRSPRSRPPRRRRLRSWSPSRGSGAPPWGAADVRAPAVVAPAIRVVPRAHDSAPRDARHAAAFAPRTDARAGAAVLTVLALRPFTALIGPASLTLFGRSLRPRKRSRFAAVAVTTVAIAAFRAGCWGRGAAAGWEIEGAGLSVLNQLRYDHDAGLPFGRARRLGSGLWRAHRRGPLGRDALHCGLLARRACFLRRGFLCFFFGRRADEVVARRQCIGLFRSSWRRRSTL